MCERRIRLTAKVIGRRNNARRSTGAIEQNKCRAPPGAGEWWRGGAAAGEQKRGFKKKKGGFSAIKKKQKKKRKEWESGSSSPQFFFQARVRVPQSTSAAPKRTSILVQVCKRAHPSNPHFDFVYFTIYSHVIFCQNHTFSPPKKAGVDKNTDLANQRPKNWTQSSRGQRSAGTADPPERPLTDVQESS